MIKQTTIEQILNRADLRSVFEDTGVELKKMGRSHVCCCPLHGEKTPSLHVNAAQGFWKCFGCGEGGNAISWVMKHQGLTFPEAVKRLAQRWNVEIDETPESNEEREARLKRESLLAMNERVARFYEGELKRGAEGKAAHSYAVLRFGEDLTARLGLGYARKGALLRWAYEQRESIDALMELGLVKRSEKSGELYEFYRERLMIPIKDRMGNVVGFTARDLSGREDTAKYLNSNDSLVFHKSRLIFGEDVAWRAGMKAEQLLLVEGAADAIKMWSVGLLHAVAPLGGVWQGGQFEKMRKIVSSVCFINDADPVPADHPWGAGIAFVIKNGIEAVRHGLAVSVRELPNGEGNTKQDPGDFFTAQNKLCQLPEEDFILWYAHKLIRKEDTIFKKGESVKQVAELASWIEDDSRLDLLVDELVKLRKGKEFWRNLIFGFRAARRKNNDSTDEIDLKVYGFTEEKGCYFGMSDKGEKMWSNFTMKPLFHIREDESPRRLFAIENVDRHKDIVELSMEELNSLSKFRQHLEGLGNYMWLGNDSDLTKLKSYLYANTETARKCVQLGQNPAGFYAWGNGIYYKNQFRKADDYGIVRLDNGTNWYIPAASKLYKEDRTRFERARQFAHLGGTVKREEYFRDFVRVFGDNGKIGLLYWLASLFRDIITAHTRSFPLLNLFGPKGSGKTELGAALMCFFVADNKAPNLKNSTSVALNDDVSFAAGALVHFDEYKNDVRPDKIEFLKGLYDGVGRTKMGGAAFDERKMTTVKSGIIVSGQEIPTADIALFHRCLYLQFPRSEFTLEERRRFAELREVQKSGLTHLTLQALSLRERMEARFPECFEDAVSAIAKGTNNAPYETRIVENWAKMLAVYRALSDAFPLPFTYEDVFGFVCQSIATQNEMSGESNEIAKFWEILMYLRSNGDIFEESDYRIKLMNEIKSNTTQRIFDRPRPVLLLNSSRLFMLYKEAAKRTGDKVIPDDALREYLKNADYYLGQVASVRFKSIIKGMSEHVINEQGEKSVAVTRVMRAMAFDYEQLKERFQVHLESNTPITDDEIC